MFNHMWKMNVSCGLRFHPANSRTFSCNWKKINVAICQTHLADSFYLKPDTIQKLAHGCHADVIVRVLNALVQAYQKPQKRVATTAHQKKPSGDSKASIKSKSPLRKSVLVETASREAAKKTKTMSSIIQNVRIDAKPQTAVTSKRSKHVRTESSPEKRSLLILEPALKQKHTLNKSMSSSFIAAQSARVIKTER
jgi:hypothetical protein